MGWGCKFIRSSGFPELIEKQSLGNFLPALRAEDIMPEGLLQSFLGQIPPACLYNISTKQDRFFLRSASTLLVNSTADNPPFVPGILFRKRFDVFSLGFSSQMLMSDSDTSQGSAVLKSHSFALPLPQVLCKPTGKTLGFFSSQCT